MSNPFFEVNADGVFTVDTSTVKEKFEEAYKAALGATLNVKDGVQKQLILNDTETVVTFMNDIALLLNANNIFTATGNALDSVGARFGYYRKKKTQTVVTAVLTGTAGAIVPIGALASDGENTFALTNVVVLGDNGKATAEFQCTVGGAIPCLAGNLNKIVSNVIGWESVTNLTNGIVGVDTESDNVFRQRILGTLLQMRSRTLLGAIAANVGQTAGVVSSFVQENPVNVENVIRGVVMPPYSIYVAALGGTGNAIAETLTKTKTLGCPMTGNTLITYYDILSKYNNNYRIERPAELPIFIKVSYHPTDTTPSNVQDLIKQKIVSYFNLNTLQIAENISTFTINQALKDFLYAEIYSVSVRSDSAGEWSIYVNVNANQIPTVSAENISFEVI